MERIIFVTLFPKNILCILIGSSYWDRRCWVNFQCRGVLLIWITVGQGPIVLAVGADGGCLEIFFSHLPLLFFLPLSGRRPARYRLKHCLKGPLSPKQPTNQLTWTAVRSWQNIKYKLKFSCGVCHAVILSL